MATAITRVAAVLGLVLGTALPAVAAEMLPVPTATIYPGDTITAAMLADRAFQDGTTARFPVVAVRDEVVGKVARRTLLPGKAIYRNSFAEADLVTRGTVIRAVYEDGALEMSTLVLPLQNGTAGARIQVRNVDSGQIIVGTVGADGGIRIGTP